MRVGCSLSRRLPMALDHLLQTGKALRYPNISKRVEKGLGALAIDRPYSWPLSLPARLPLQLKRTQKLN